MPLTDNNSNSTSLADKFNAYGAIFVTVAIYSLFAASLIISYHPPSADSILSPAFNNMVETIKLLAVSVTSYWVGNSSSSSKKDDTIAQQSSSLATSAPVDPFTQPSSTPTSAPKPTPAPGSTS